jgi:hypothetical protein
MQLLLDRKEIWITCNRARQKSNPYFRRCQGVIKSKFMFKSLKFDRRSKKATYLKRPNLRKRFLSHFNSTLLTRVVCLYMNFLTLLKKSSSQMDREKNF